MEYPQQELMKGMKRLHDNAEYSDFAIQCQGVTYNVHKAIVCPRSEFFAAASRWPAPSTSPASKKPRGDQESHSVPGADKEQKDDVRVVDMDDDDPFSVWAMVQYLYHLSYPIPSDTLAKEVLKKGNQAGSLAPGGNLAKDLPTGSSYAGQDTWSCLGRHAKIYSLADKYAISGLKRVARDAIRDTLNDYMYACDIAISGTYAYYGPWDSLVACVKEVYTSTPHHDRGLRDLITSTLRRNMHLFENEGLKALMLEIAQLSFDVLMEYHRDPLHRGKYKLWIPSETQMSSWKEPVLANLPCPPERFYE